MIYNMKKILLVAVMALVSFGAFAQPKFAHVRFQELWQLAPEADDARAKMATSSKEAQETYQAMVDEFNSKYQAYQSQASTMSQATRQLKEKELTEIQQRIQEFQQTITAELEQQQQVLFQPILEKAQGLVKSIAKNHGCIYVFDESSLLYIDDAQSVDITPEARKAMGISDDRTMESLQAELQAQQQAQQAQQAN